MCVGARVRESVSFSRGRDMKFFFLDSIHRNSRLYREGEKEGEMDGRTFRENDDARGSQRARAQTHTLTPRWVIAILRRKIPSVTCLFTYVFIYIFSSIRNSGFARDVSFTSSIPIR
jgi:hypothetical protein